MASNLKNAPWFVSTSQHRHIAAKSTRKTENNWINASGVGIGFFFAKKTKSPYQMQIKQLFLFSAEYAFQEIKTLGSRL